MGDDDDDDDDDDDSDNEDVGRVTGVNIILGGR